jgi:lipoprotein NlpI
MAWWHLAAARSLGPAQASAALAVRAKALDLNDAAWPLPVIAPYLGKIDLQKMRAKARDGDPAELDNRLCEADFYGAEWLLMRGEAAAARPALAHAEQSCPRTFIERIGAHAELHWLNVAPDPA